MSQPKLIRNTAEPTFEVLKRLVDRKAEAGRLKYGVALQPLNGRCSLVDLLDELVDGSKYALNEIRNQREILTKLVGWSNDLAAVVDPGAYLVQQGIEELFVALGGWRALSVYDEVCVDGQTVPEALFRHVTLSVPRQYGMTEQVPPAAVSSERQTGGDFNPPQISSFHKAVEDPLPEIESMTTTETSPGRLLRAVVLETGLMRYVDVHNTEDADFEETARLYEARRQAVLGTVANDATVRDQILDDVLVLLAGAGIATPERTYKADGGWGLALSDLKKLVADRVSILEQVKRLGQANADLRRERNRAVEEAKRLSNVLKSLRAVLSAAKESGVNDGKA